MIGEALITVALLIGPAWLASWLGWPLGEHTNWTWFRQYLRGGTIPDEVVIAALVVALWGLWAAHLVVVALDIVALLRGLVPRVGLVRLVWVLAAGGATAASTHTAAVAAQTHTVAEAAARPDLGSQEERAPENRTEEQESGVIDRTRNLSGFAFDSDQLTPEMKESLEPTVSMISDFGLPGSPVVVTGHTDPVGSPAYNQYLSEQRAQAVADYLAEHLGDVEFEIQGAGSSQAPDNPQASYGEYRRVKVSYSLQQPTAPEVVTETEAAPAADAESVPEQARVDVDTVGGQSQGPNALLVGAAAGVAGVGVGYAAGRRHGGTRRTHSTPQAHAPEREREEDLPSDTTENPEPDAGELLREDPHGIARGVIDEDGFVLVADTSRVSGRHGLGFVGAHAGSVLAAVVADHAPSRVIATCAAVAALGGTEAMPPGARLVADVSGARIAAEAEILTAERCRMDDQDSPQSDQKPPADRPWVLVVCDASDLDTEPEPLQTLTAIPGTVVSVLGDHDALGTVVQCNDLDRTRLTNPRGEIDLPLPLRHRPRTDTGSHTPASGPSRSATTFAPGPVPHAAVAEHRGEENTNETTHQVQVKLFAPEPELTLHGEPVTGLRAVARTLLAFLALHPEGADADQIADVCFADADPVKATGHRRNAIHSLRTTLRKQLNIPGEQIIRSDEGLYRIDESIFEVDLWKFLRLASVLRKDGGEASESNLRILEIHQEHLLSGHRDAWILPARERCVKEAVDACVRLAESTHVGAEKAQFLEKALSFDEYNEPLYQRIMVAYQDAGSPEGAHRAYRELKERLSVLGETPSRESRRIVQDCVPASL